MTANPKAFGRFFSAPNGPNLGNISKENGNTNVVPRTVEDFRINIEPAPPRKRSFFHQMSSVAEQEIDGSEEGAQLMSDILQDPRFMRITSVLEDESDNKDIVISSEAPPKTMVETCLTFHRDLKPGSQWFRWNLLFNLLLWLIVPFPLWMPFVSNRVAYYMIPSIQGVFILMWTSEYALSPIVFRLLFRLFSYCYISFEKYLYCIHKSLS